MVVLSLDAWGNQELARNRVGRGVAGRPVPLARAPIPGSCPMNTEPVEEPTAPGERAPGQSGRSESVAGRRPGSIARVRPHASCPRPSGRYRPPRPGTPKHIEGALAKRILRLVHAPHAGDDRPMT